MNEEIKLQLAKDVHSELVQDILPFWMQKMTDHENGGFYGQMDGNDRIISDAPKGGIMNARILWIFAAAYRTLKKQEYLETAIRAKEYIFKHFFDSNSGGTYWSLDYKGEPLDTKKQIYSQAFFIYALSEYFLATGDEKCKNEAINLFRLIEKHSFDKALNGYFEAYSNDWQLLTDLRLSAKDANEKKTMNTHLHILEAYTNLYRIWKDETLAFQLRNLVNIFVDKIVDSHSSHLNLFFDENWECKSTITSYGHDIESSWLLYGAALELGDSVLTEKVRKICLRIIDAAEEGLQPDGSLIYEKENATGHSDFERHWWPQAEAVVGFYNAYELSGDNKHLLKASKSYSYIQSNLIDPVNGEWYWSILSNGSVNRNGDKAGFWKCPYHNGRMCLEIMKRIG
ncbi:MAG: AGE family epimerase/isomerase [Lentimicrobiaceae bacterium]|jgi:mannobiose 2-epimerase